MNRGRDAVDGDRDLQATGRHRPTHEPEPRGHRGSSLRLDERDPGLADREGLGRRCRIDVPRSIARDDLESVRPVREIGERHKPRVRELAERLVVEAPRESQVVRRSDVV